MATSEMRRWSGGMGDINRTVCFNIVYRYGAQWYEQFLQIGWLDRALLLLDLALLAEPLCIFFVVRHVRYVF